MRLEAARVFWRRARLSRTGTVLIGVVASLGTSCASRAGADRDAVPAYRDLVVEGKQTSEPSQGGYEYVARRPLAVVALAEARGIGTAVARAAVDHLADTLDTCATEHAKGGAASQGAARVVAQIDEAGAVAATQVRIEPGPHVAEDALICLVAPVKLLTFPAGSASNRGIAVEALWGQLP